MKNNNNSHIDVAIYFVAKLVPALLGFLNIFCITRSLTPERYGEYALVITAVLISSQIFGAWITQAMLYYLPKEKGGNEMVASLGKMTFYSTLVGMVVIVIVLLFFKVGFEIAIAGAMVFVCQMYWTYLSTYHQAREQAKIQLHATFFQVGVQLSVITTLFFLAQINVLSAILSVCIGFFSGVYFFYMQNKRDEIKILSIQKIPAKVFLPNVKLAFAYGGPMCAWFLFSQIYTFSDRFLLRNAGLSGDLGRYAAVRDLLLGVISMIAMPLLMVAHPMIMRIWHERRSTTEIQALIQKNLTVIFIIGCFLTLILYDYGDVILSIAFSKKYQLKNIEYALISATILIGVASMYAHKALEVNRATISMALITAVVAIFSVGANLILVGKYGLSSIILVGLFSQILYFAVASLLSRPMWRVVIAKERVLVVCIAVIAIHVLSKIVDQNFSARLYLAIPWGLLIELICISVSALIFPEVHQLFAINLKTKERPVLDSKI